MTLALTVEAVTEETLFILRRMLMALEPARFSRRYTEQLREKFLDQIDQAFAAEAAPEGISWAGLSDWRIAERDGSESPILYWTGSLYQEAMGYRGRTRDTVGGFSYWFPDAPEMSPRAWGLLAGQQANPLGAKPLAVTPRPILGGTPRQGRDAVDVLRAYFVESGFLVEVG